VTRIILDKTRARRFFLSPQENQIITYPDRKVCGLINPKAGYLLGVFLLACIRRTLPSVDTGYRPYSLKQGLQRLTPPEDLILTGSGSVALTVKVFAGTTNVIIIYGSVYRLTP
jgi:hypothetical protein